MSDKAGRSVTPIGFVPKGWGYEYIFANSNEHGYCGKVLFVKKGLKSSFHFHKEKHETFYILSGRMRLIYAEGLQGEVQQLVLGPSDRFEVPPNTPHRFQAEEDLTFIEASTTDTVEDTVRIEKGD